MKDRLTALIVTGAVALCLVIVLVAVAVLLVEQHTVPAVAIGLVTTLAAFLAPSPLGHVPAGVSDAVQAVLTGAGAAAAAADVPVAPVAGIDLTHPDPNLPAAPAAPSNVTVVPTQGDAAP